MAPSRRRSKKAQQVEEKPIVKFKRGQFKLKTPKNRKRLIRDLPKEAAKFLHPSLRPILTGKQKKWNSGSPLHRIAVNLVKRSKRQLKPRVMPFFCDKCRLSSRSLKNIREHICELADRRRADRLAYQRKYTDYSYAHHLKLVQNPEKQWRYNSMAALEQTLRPDKVYPVFENADELLEPPPYDPNPTKKFLAAEKAEFEDYTAQRSISRIMVKNTQIRPKTTLVIRGRHPGIFCFVCKGSFESFNQYQLHLDENFLDGKCSKVNPSYTYTQKEDTTGVCNPKYNYSNMHVRPTKRDVSHVKCTLCQQTNFQSTSELYKHMMDCATKKDADGKCALDQPSVFKGLSVAAFFDRSDVPESS